MPLYKVELIRTTVDFCTIEIEASTHLGARAIAQAKMHLGINYPWYAKTSNIEVNKVEAADAEPVFEGHKTGKAEMWMSMRVSEVTSPLRLRLRKPNGKWEWCSVSILQTSEWFKDPCWWDKKRRRHDVQMMKDFDREYDVETIFLGYF